MLTTSTQSPAAKPTVVEIDSGGAINASTIGGYRFSGSCLENGQNNMEFSVASSGSANGTEPIVGKISCEEGEWSLAFSDHNLSNLPDGEITLSLSLSDFSTDLTIVKDTVTPVMDQVSRTKSAWRCDSDSANPCPDTYRYRVAVSASSTHTFLNDVAFLTVAQDSFLESVSSNGDQDLYLHVQAKDAAGNISVVASSQSFRHDNVAPVATGATAASSNVNTALGREADTITVTLTFNENVTATGTPAIDLGSSRTADCTNCDATAKRSLTFSYSVGGTDNGTLQVAGLVFDAGESLADGAGNQVSASLASPVSVSGITLDTTSPVVQNIVISGTSWNWGCSEASCEYRFVINTAATTLTSLSTNYGTAATASSATMANGNYYVHVQAKDSAGNESAILTGAVIAVSGSQTPVISSVGGPSNGSYKIGDQLDFQVNFAATVPVDTAGGTPRLPLRIGTQDRLASYQSGSGSATLVFRYTVVAGDIDSDGVALGSSGSVDLNGGSIANLSSATISFSSQTFTGVLVDGVIPTLTGATAVSSNLNTAFGKQGDTITVTLTFNEDITAAGTAPAIDLGSSRTADCTNCDATAKRSLTFSYSVVGTDNGTLQVAGLVFEAGESLADGAGNQVSASLASPVSVSGITLDTTNPVVQNIVAGDSSWSWGCSETSCEYRFVVNTASTTLTSLSTNYGSAAISSTLTIAGTYYVHIQARDSAGNESAILAGADSITYTPLVITGIEGPVDGTYALGQFLDFPVSFDKTVVVGGVPQLPLQIGTNARSANYHSGSGSATLVFRYTVVANDTDSDGVALGSSGALSLNGGSMNSLSVLSLTFTAKDFTNVLVDGSSAPTVTITSTHTDEITTANAASYSVAGGCVAGDVRVRVGGIAPSSTPSCSLSGTWTATLNVGNLPTGSATITASQTSGSVTKHATPVFVTVGEFEQIVRASRRIDKNGYQGSGSSDHTCVVRANGRVSCWGDNSEGQLGNNSTNHANYPVDVRGPTGIAGTFLENIVEVSTGSNHTCALNSGGQVLCWGDNFYGQIGNNYYYSDHHYPTLVKGKNGHGTLSGIVQLAGGISGNCVLGSNGQVSCWGWNALGNVGVAGNTAKIPYPSTIRVSQNGPPLEGIVQISYGYFAPCALTSKGKVWCWGASYHGQLGDGTSGGSIAGAHIVYPVAVRASTGASGSTLDGVVQISVGSNSNCALKSNKTVYCWGTGYFGEANIEETHLFPHLLNLTNVSAIDQSRNREGSFYDVITKCALDFSGTAKCWGWNSDGQLADANRNNKSFTTIRSTGSSQRALQGIVGIRPGLTSTCALMVTGKVKCWGANAFLGRGGGGGSTYYPDFVLSGASGSHWVPGARSSHYICRKNFSRCTLSPVSLAPGGEGSNHIISVASPVLKVYGLHDGQTLTLYSDTSCSSASAFTGGTLAGVTATNPQTVTLSNDSTTQERSLSYKIGGDREVNSTLCLKSPITFDRAAPADPTAIYFGASEPAPEATYESFTVLPTTVKVKVAVNATDSIKEYTVEVYLGDNTCSEAASRVATGAYSSAGTLTLTMTTPNYQWNTWTLNNQNQSFKFYTKSLDSAGNSSSCVASLTTSLPIPNPNSAMF